MDDGSADRALRWSRALVLSLVALSLSAVFHGAAGGLTPGPGELAALLAGSTACAGPLLGREASTRRVVALLVLWQAGLHAGLSAAAGHVDEPSAPGRAGTGATWRPSTGFDLLSHLLAAEVGEHLLMAAAHAGAAAAVGLWLAAVERALWRLLALGVRGLRTGWGALTSYRRAVLLRVGACREGQAPTAPVDRTPGAAPVLLLTRVVPRRGPPLPAA